MKRLNSRGFTHLLALLLIVVGVSIAGTYTLVSGHAETAAEVKARSVKKASSKVGLALHNSKSKGYYIRATVISTKKPVTAETCGGTLFMAVIKTGKTTIINDKGSFPTWTGTQCSYEIPVDAKYITEATDKKGNLKLRVSTNYRGTIDYHQFKKNTTIKSAIAGD